jgi:hypothetical protein
MAANTSLTRECLELILRLGEAMDWKRTKPPTKVSPHPLPELSEAVPAELSTSEKLDANHD